MLGEYVAITTMCAMATILFLGGWLPPVALPPFTWIPGVIWFSLKLFFMFFLFAMAKAIVPRYRYDQLMRLGWKVFLPLSLAMGVVVAGVLHFAGIAPNLGCSEWEYQPPTPLAFGVRIRFCRLFRPSPFVQAAADAALSL